VTKGVPEHLRSDNGPEFVADPLHPVLANMPACPLEQRRNPAIAIAAILVGQRYDGAGERIFVVSLCWPMALCAAWLFHHTARTPLAHAMRLPRMLTAQRRRSGLRSFPRRCPSTSFSRLSSETRDCERVLVTLLRNLGPHRESLVLVGGLTPRYLVPERPPVVPQHAGTLDIDVVIDLVILEDTEAYRTLEENLKKIGFELTSVKLAAFCSL
jgi:hypothetical protein